VPSHDSHDQQPADPSPSGPDHIDTEFAKIVASFDAAPQWPVPEGATEPPKPAKGPVWPAAGPVLNQPSLLDGLDTFGAHLPDDTPEKFVPPPPPPWPKVPFAAILAVVSVIFGFVLFFDRGLLPVPSEVGMLLGVAGVLGGAAALIMRLRPGTEEDESGDDGAVV
jgi:hypothetical protein